MNMKYMNILPVLGHQNGTQKFWQELLKLGVTEDHDNPEIILVLGGDGTMLGAQEKHAHLHVPFLGIGFGSTNFLLNQDIATAKDVCEKLAAGVWREITSQALHAKIICESGEFEACAYNDIYLKSQNPAEAIRMRVTANEDFPGGLTLQGDGVIIANPTGSTAYTKNAGGSVLPLKSPLWAMTGICTKQDVRLTLEHQTIVIELERSRAALVTDNRVYNDVTRAVITASDTIVMLLFDEAEDINQRRYGS